MKQYTLIIELDSDPINPRTEYDNLGTLFITDNRYFSGDDSATDPRELDDIAVCLPVFAYIHSGVILNTEGFGCQWDSGQSGFIYITEEQFKNEYGEKTEENIETATRVLKSEIELYNMYLSGQVYGFRVVQYETCNLGHRHERELDSCWGFFGSDIKTNGMAEHLEHGLNEYEIKENF